MANVPVTPVTFKNIVDITVNRAGIAGKAQDRDLSLIKTAINEANQEISTERSWRWRKMDRSITFQLPITTATVDATNGSRIITLQNIVVTDQHLGRTIRVSADPEIYRIIGIKASTNQLYLESAYVGTTIATAPLKIYKYEFALPPDLDGIMMIYADQGYNYSDSKSGELTDQNNIEFNRMLSIRNDMNGPPSYYTRDGNVFLNDLPPLDEMVLDYDFLGGDRLTQVSRLRLFPIEPDKDTMLHLNYSLIVPPLLDDNNAPLMPVDDRWVLVHAALEEWHRKNSSGAMADREEKKKKEKLKMMRDEFQKTDVKPQFVFDGTRYRRQRALNDWRLLHQISRIGEAS